MKLMNIKRVLLIIGLALSKFSHSQEVPVPRPISTVLPVSAANDGIGWLVNSPMLSNKNMDMKITPPLQPLPTPEIELPKMDSVWLKGAADLPAYGVSDYDSSKAENGVTLLDLVTRSMLIDMNGKILGNLPIGLTNLFPDGTMLGAIPPVLVKFDSDKNLLWKTWASPHHEITTDENGAIYLLSSEEHDFMGLKVHFDLLKIFSPEGNLIYEWHVFDHLQEVVTVISKSAYLNTLHDTYDPAKGVSKYIAQDPERFFWHQIPVYSDTTSFEFTHCNSIQVLPENGISKKIPAFRKGNLLLSFNPYSCYGILDTATGNIEWAGYLPERTTLHTPLLTPAGTILVFQNSTEPSLWPNKKTDGCLKYLHGIIPPQNPSPDPKSRNWASVTEYDPFTNKKVWEYTANPKESLSALYLGNAQRLSNGNTLVCTASEKGGQVLEVTPDKEIVWRYISEKKNPESNTPLSFYRAKRISLEIAQKIIPGFKK